MINPHIGRKILTGLQPPKKPSRIFVPVVGKINMARNIDPTYSPTKKSGEASGFHSNGSETIFHTQYIITVGTLLEILPSLLQKICIHLIL